MSSGVVSRISKVSFNILLRLQFELNIFQINFVTKLGKFELEITTFQMAVLFAWTKRSQEKITYESLRLATELPDLELRRTLWVSLLNIFESESYIFYNQIITAISSISKVKASNFVLLTRSENS